MTRHVVGIDAPDSADIAKVDDEESALERSIQNAIKNVTSKEAVSAIKDQLCEECDEVTFIFRTSSRKWRINTFLWRGDKFMDKIKEVTGMGAEEEKRITRSCCSESKGMDLRSEK